MFFPVTMLGSAIRQLLVHYIGTRERDNLFRVGLVAYRKFSADELPRDHLVTEDMIAIQPLKLQTFQQYLWLMKDNAASVVSGFVE